MRHSSRIRDFIFICSLLLTAVGLAEEIEQPKESSAPQESDMEKPSVALSVGTFDAESVRDAGIGLRLKEAAELYFYPREFRSIVSLFGYPLEDIQSACTNSIGDGIEESKTLAGIDVGRIARIVDDSVSRTREIVSRDNATGSTLESKNDLSNQTLEKLCNSLGDLSENKNQDRLVIATENPIPILKPTHRYLVENVVLAKRTSHF